MSLPFVAMGQSPGTKLWDVDLRGAQFSSPSLGPDGTIYVSGRSNGSSLGDLTAISPDGQRLWRSLTDGGGELSAPCIGPDGSIYSGTARGLLLSFSSSGQTNWVFQTGDTYPVSSPALGVDGTVYVKAYTRTYQRLYSVSPTGSTNWIVTLDRNPSFVSPFQMAAPVIGADGTVYVASTSNLFAINPTGTTNWTFPLTANSLVSPAIGLDGTLYLGTDDNHVLAITHHGQLRWRHLADGFVESSAAVGADGSIYVGYYKNDLGGLLALTSTGEKRWSHDQGMGVSGSPAIDDAGNVYVAELFGSFRAVDPAGSNIWSFAIDTPTHSSPVISPDGIIYVMGGSKLYAFVGGSPLMRCAWPMFRGGPRRTARAPQCGIQSSLPRSDGTIDLLLRTEIDANYQLQRSTNLFDWSSLLDFTATRWNPTLQISNGAFPKEFFRLQSIPN